MQKFITILFCLIIIFFIVAIIFSILALRAECINPEPKVIITECQKCEPEIIYQKPEIEYYPEYISVEKEVVKEVIDEECQVELNTIKEELSVYHRELCNADPENTLCNL